MKYLLRNTLINIRNTANVNTILIKKKRKQVLFMKFENLFLSIKF